MSKRKFLISLPLTLVLLLSACGANGSPASGDENTAVDNGPEITASKEMPDEPYEAVAYGMHPAPEGAYVGDVMPFVTKDGELELYYLYDTSHNGQGYHPIYKYSTKDLVSYEDHGMMLNNGQGSDPDPALGTGSVMQDKDGVYHLFYTGHNDNGNGGRGKECVMQATSTDREHWVKDGEVLFFAPEGYNKDDFRDPEVFWVEEEKCYWLLMSANVEPLDGVVVKYTSTDLKNWDFYGPVFAPMNEYMCECPDLFKIGDYWYLTYSWDCVTYYAMSDSMYGPFVPPRDNILDGKGLTEGAGFIFYAAKPAEIGNHVYLCGWIGQAGLSSDSGIYQWAGNVLVHEIVQHEDGTLGLKAPDALDDHFVVDKPVSAAAIQGDVKINGGAITLTAEDGTYALADMGTRPAAMVLECDVKIEDECVAGFAFGGSDTDETWAGLCLDGRRNVLHYEGYDIADAIAMEPAAITKFDFSRNSDHHIKLVCENEIVILYIDDMKALSSRIVRSTNGAHIGVFTDGSDVTFSNITMTLPE